MREKQCFRGQADFRRMSVPVGSSPLGKCRRNGLRSRQSALWRALFVIMAIASTFSAAGRGRDPGHSEEVELRARNLLASAQTDHRATSMLARSFATDCNITALSSNGIRL